MSALEYTKQNYYAVADMYPDKIVVITEAGWATNSNGRGIDAHNVSEELQRYSQIIETFDPAPAEGVWISNTAEPMTTVDVIDASEDFAIYGKVGRMISDAAGLPWQNAVLTMTDFSIDVTTTKTITSLMFISLALTR
ncbi:unnamed protein product [Bathycoccus prasinos]